MSIYQQLGQERGIGTAVDEFYRRLLGDPQLSGYVIGVDPPTIGAVAAELGRHREVIVSREPVG